MKSTAHPSMLRKERALSTDECWKILTRSEYCVLATADKRGSPYTTPLSYVAYKGALYFHCGHAGHKVDNLKENSQCSMVVIANTHPVYVHKDYTTHYESVIVFGHAKEIVQPEEKIEVLYELVRKYFPDKLEPAERYIKGLLSRTAVYAIIPEHISGKANRAKE